MPITVKMYTQKNTKMVIFPIAGIISTINPINLNNIRFKQRNAKQKSKGYFFKDGIPSIRNTTRSSREIRTIVPLISLGENFHYGHMKIRYLRFLQTAIRPKSWIGIPKQEEI